MRVTLPVSNAYCVMTQTPNLLNIVLLALTNTLYYMFSATNHMITDYNFNQRFHFINID